jgi:succinate-acetate transporter protein
LAVTAFVITWTFGVQSFTAYGSNWAIWPVLFSVPFAAAIHIYLVAALRPKWPLVGYAVVHLLALVLVVAVCMMLISKDSL